ISEGAAISPMIAAKAPRGPRNFMPSATDILMMLPPGRNWHRPSSSVKSSDDSQRFFSTTMWRASGRAPPKALSPSQKKPVNNAHEVGGAGWRTGSGSERGEADMAGYRGQGRKPTLARAGPQTAP